MPIPSLRRACCGGFTLLILAMATAQAHAGCDPLNYVVPAPDPAMPRVRTTLINTNPNGCQDGFAIAIDSGGQLVNQGGFLLLPGLLGANGNGGLLILGGTLTNAASGTLDNRADFYVGFTPYYGGTLNNDGLFTNNALLVNAGSLVNNKTLVNNGTLSMVGIGSSFANHGQIDNAAGATIDLTAPWATLDWAGGTVNNAGTLRVTYLDIGTASGPNGNYDTFNLLPGSRLETSDLTIHQGVTQLNAGTLVNTGSMGVYGRLDNDGDIQTGSLTLDYPGFGLGILNNRSGGTLTLGSASGVWPGGAATPAKSVISGYLFNSGTMTIKGDALVIVGATGEVGGASGVLQNNNILVVHGRLQNDLAMQNNGDMTVLGQFASSGDFTNVAHLENQGSVNITGNFTHQGDVINRGQFVFAAGSTTQGLGTYQQTDGATWINGTVDLPQIQIDGGALCGTGQLHGTLSLGGSASICTGGGPVVSMLRATARLPRLADAEPAGLTVSGDLVLSGGTLSFDIGGTAPGSFGSLVIGGHVLGTRGTLQLNFINGYQPTVGSSWALLGSQDTDPLSGFTLEVAGLPAGYDFAAGPGGSIGVTTVPVPEPQTAWLLLAGLVGLASWRRAGRHCAAARAALRRWRPNHLPAAVALAAACAAQAPAGATVLVTAGAKATAGNQGTSPVTAIQQEAAGLVGATAAQGNDTTETWVRQASATATASVGSLHVATQSTYLHTQGQKQPNDLYSNASASADASWTDTLLITSPTHTTGSGSRARGCCRWMSASATARRSAST